MAFFGDYFEKDAALLVKQITGYQEGEENFRLSLQYVLSEFRYHRYLDVAHQDVKKIVDGLNEKFVVHSQTEKADALLALTSKILDRPLLTTTQDSTLCSIVALLLHLSNQPTEHEYEPPESLYASEIEDTAFDWGKYLKEGEEIVSPYASDSDWSVTDDEELEAKDRNGDKQSFKCGRSLNVTKQVSVPPTNVATEQFANSKCWLKQNAILQYWNESYAEEDAAYQHRFTRLHRDWEKYLKDKEEIFVSTSTTLVTEYHLLRETLWVLQGIGELFLFTREGDGYSFTGEAYLSHLTYQSLRLFIGNVISCANVVFKFRKFAKDVIANSCSKTDVNSTYNAYQTELSRQLCLWNRKLSALERNVLKQSSVYTLSSLANDLASDFRMFAVLDQIHVAGIEASTGLSNSEKSVALLNSLYKAVIEGDVAASNDDHVLKCVLRVFLKTFRPYADIVDSWISSGKLLDQWNEFIFEGMPKAKSEAMDDEFCASLTDMQSSMCKRAIEKPLFLSSEFISKLILVGKSTELLFHLGQPIFAASSHKQFSAETSLYKEFLKNLVEETCESTESERSSDDGTFESRSSHRGVDEGKLIHYLISSIEKDDLLLMNLRNLRGDSEKPPESVSFSDDDDADGLIAKLVPPFLSPLERAIDNSLNTYMQNMYARTCKYLIDVLKDEYDLMSYLSLMRKFYLLEDGDTMFSFYSDIFERIQFSDYRQRDSLLTFILQDSISGRYPQHVSNMSVNLDFTPCQQPLDLLNGLQLCFKIPWPVDMVITTDMQNMYNAIFRFLLQLKWAKYSLDGLAMRRVSTLLADDTDVDATATSDLDELKSRIYLLRMMLMHFVNGIHNFIMTETLHTTGVELEKCLACAKDLEQVIATHRTYVNQLHLRCLFHEKDSVVRNAILWVLNSSLEFQKKWKSNFKNFTIKDVLKTENELKQWCKFLASLKREEAVPENSLLHWLQLYVLPCSSFG